MGNHRPKCTGCGKTSSLSIPDEQEGFQTTWECPDFECSTKNYLDGTTPAELALERVAAEETDTGAVSVTDVDHGSTGEVHT